METNNTLKLQTIYGHIELTEAEKEAAILEAKIKKYFKEKNKEYWQSLEKQNQHDRPTTNTSAT